QGTARGRARQRGTSGCRRWCGGRRRHHGRARGRGGYRRRGGPGGRATRGRGGCRRRGGPGGRATRGRGGCRRRSGRAQGRGGCRRRGGRGRRGRLDKVGLEGTDVAGKAFGISATRAALVRRRALYDRDRIYRRTPRLERDGLRRSTVVGEPRGVEE